MKNDFIEPQVKPFRPPKGENMSQIEYMIYLEK